MGIRKTDSVIPMNGWQPVYGKMPGGSFAVYDDHRLYVRAVGEPEKDEGHPASITGFCAFVDGNRIGAFARKDEAQTEAVRAATRH